MNDADLEYLLRRALRAQDPGEAFCERILARASKGTEATEERAPPASPRRRGSRALARWAPVALAACLMAGIGLAHWSQLQRQRGFEARAQLLLALNIASRYVDTVRGAVIHEEELRPEDELTP